MNIGGSFVVPQIKTMENNGGIKSAVVITAEKRGIAQTTMIAATMPVPAVGAYAAQPLAWRTRFEVHLVESIAALFARAPSQTR